MSVNKIIYGGLALIDLTGDTVTSDSLEVGKTAHSQSGEKITGELTKNNGVRLSMNGELSLVTKGMFQYVRTPVKIAVNNDLKKTIVENGAITADVDVSASLYFGNAKVEQVAKGARFTSFNGINIVGTYEPETFNIQRLTDETTKLKFTANKVWAFGYGKTSSALYSFHGNLINYRTSAGNRSTSVSGGFNVVNGLVNLTVANLTEMDVVVIDVNSV